MRLQGLRNRCLEAKASGDEDLRAGDLGLKTAGSASPLNGPDVLPVVASGQGKNLLALIGAKEYY